jgi:hypothetical protein
MHKDLKAGDALRHGLFGVVMAAAWACASPTPNNPRAQTAIPAITMSDDDPTAGTGPATSIGTGVAAGQAAIIPTLAAGSTGTPPKNSTPGAAGMFAMNAGRAGVPMLGGAGAPAANSGNPPPMPGPPVGTGKTCLKPGNGNYNEPGPYKVATKEVDLGMIEASQHTGKFTIYYPDPLETSCLHPIVGWGNGTGVQGAGVYAFLNTNAASWGMVVAESEEDNTGSGNFHKAGIDYLLKQNADPSSIFYQKLSTRAGTSGHSQGGFGASAANSHPNVVASVIEGASNVSTSKVSVLVLTGTKDIVMGAENLVTSAMGPMFVAVWEGGDHFTTETLAGYIIKDAGSLQFERLYAAWMRCFLADDAVACKLFSGGTPSGCGICKDMGWHILASKNM